MKITRILVCAALAMASFIASAAYGPIRVLFSTKGPDTYASGEPVKVGEWYALVWSENAAFGGFTSDCRPAVEGDKLLLMAPLAELISADDPAKGTHCPEVVFNVQRDKVPQASAGKTGRFFLVLLDTRGVDGNPAAKGDNNLPVRVNAALDEGNGAAADITVAANSDSAGSDKWAVSEAAGVDNPVITDFQVLGDDTVMFKVSGLAPSVNYNIYGGKTLAEINEFILTMPISSESNEKPVRVGIQGAGEKRYFTVKRQAVTEKIGE